MHRRSAWLCLCWVFCPMAVALFSGGGFLSRVFSSSTTSGSVPPGSTKGIAYLKISPATHTVKLVDSEATLLDMQREINQLTQRPLLNSSSDADQKLNVVGIDCEWRPENYFAKSMENSLANFPASLFAPGPPGQKRKLIRRLWERLIFGDRKREVSSSSSSKSKKVGSSPVLLLQISSRDTIWIVDLLLVCRQVAPGTGKIMVGKSLTSKESILDDTLGSLMKAENVLKVGLGLTQDLKRLGWSYPWLPATQSFRGILDIQTLAKKAYPDVARQDLEGLSKLCIRQLGGAINKELQCSDWAVRPLTKQQLHYAGLDACVLVELFDSLLSMVMLAARHKKQHSSWGPLEVLQHAAPINGYTLAFPSPRLPTSRNDLSSPLSQPTRKRSERYNNAAAAAAAATVAEAEKHETTILMVSAASEEGDEEQSAVHLRDMVMRQTK